jgi:hypothetical protein
MKTKKNMGSQSQAPTLQNNSFITTHFQTEADRYAEKCTNLHNLTKNYWTKLAMNFYMDEIFALKQRLLAEHQQGNISPYDAQTILDQIFLLFFRLDKVLHPKTKMSRSKLHFGYKLLT